MHVLVASSLIYVKWIPTEIDKILIKKHNKCVENIKDFFLSRNIKDTIKNHLKDALGSYFIAAARYVEFYHAGNDASFLLEILNKCDSSVKEVLEKIPTITLSAQSSEPALGAVE